MAFNPITPPVGLTTGLNGDLLWKASQTQSGSDGASFGSILAQSIQNVQASGAAAHQAAASFLAGDGGELHQIAVVAQKAELTMDLFLQARNKVIQAYQEIMRMQL